MRPIDADKLIEDLSDILYQYPDKNGNRLIQNKTMGNIAHIISSQPTIDSDITNTKNKNKVDLYKLERSNGRIIFEGSWEEIKDKLAEISETTQSSMIYDGLDDKQHKTRIEFEGMYCNFTLYLSKIRY